MVKIHTRIRRLNCGFNAFAPLGRDDTPDELRCMRCGSVFTRRALGANVVNLNSERRKHKVQDKSHKG